MEIKHQYRQTVLRRPAECGDAPIRLKPAEMREPRRRYNPALRTRVCDTWWRASTARDIYSTLPRRGSWHFFSSRQLQTLHCPLQHLNQRRKCRNTCDHRLRNGGPLEALRPSAGSRAGDSALGEPAALSSCSERLYQASPAGFASCRLFCPTRVEMPWQPSRHASACRGIGIELVRTAMRREHRRHLPASVDGP